MTDFLGNDIQVGDKVACIELGYKNLMFGEVVKLTPKAMRVKYKKWGQEETVLRYSDQVIKI